MANAGNVLDLATIVQHITNAQPAQLSSLAHTLKTFAQGEDQRDAILGGLLPGAQDPLAILNPGVNTLGYLYILFELVQFCICVISDATLFRSARLAGGNAAAPVDPAFVTAFCSDFNPEQARLAPSRGTLL